MEVQDLTSNKGILPMTLGTAKLIKGYSNILHIIRLGQYQQNIEKIQQTLDQLDNLGTLNITLNVTRLKLQELKHVYETLRPSLRHKRGLIDGLGTLIKGITGNMDNNDAIRLNKELENIMNNEQVIKGEMDKQIIINDKMIKRFENITNHINYQQDEILNLIKDTQDRVGNSIRQDDMRLKNLQFLNQINYHIDILNSHLKNIAEAIVLAKLNIISKQILNPKEIHDITLHFENQNSTVKSIEYLYELLKLQAYYNDTNIIFNIQIPILSHNTYTFIHIISLPINQSKLIFAKPFLLMYHDEIHYLDEKCPKIDDIYFCEEKASRFSVSDSECTGKLMRNQPANCQWYDVELASEIYQPEPNYVLLINVEETKIYSSCNPTQSLKGTKLIHFKDCEVKINNITYSTAVNTYWDEIEIHPITFNEINITFSNFSTHLRKLDQYKFSNAQPIQTIVKYFHQSDNTFTTVCFILMALFGIIQLLIIYFICKKRKYQATCDLKPTESAAASTVESKGIQFSWPMLNSKGEGVTYPAKYPIK
jgi:hypothetical protein